MHKALEVLAREANPRRDMENMGEWLDRCIEEAGAAPRATAVMGRMAIGAGYFVKDLWVRPMVRGGAVGVVVGALAAALTDSSLAEGAYAGWYVGTLVDSMQYLGRICWDAVF